MWKAISLIYLDGFAAPIDCHKPLPSDFRIERYNMSFTVVAFALEKAFQNYANKQNAAQIALAVGKELRDNNDVLIASMKQMIEAAFSANKLMECQNRLASLAVFLDEYSNNLEDEDRLSEVNLQSQYLIDILDDADVRVAGLASFATAACLRISVLRMMAFTYDSELANAKNRAKDYALHLENSLPLIYDIVKERFSDVKMQQQINQNGMLAVKKHWYYILQYPPGSLLQRREFHTANYPPSGAEFINARTAAEDARLLEINSMFESYKVEKFPEVISCIAKMKEFGSS